MNDNLPDHIKGTAYWVPFGGKGKSAYHVKNKEGGEFPVEFVNDAWYQLTWGLSGYRMSASSSITPEVRIKLGLGWYNKHNNRY
jgi:hypothetical protein